jgi:hypothetical protein
MGDAFVLRSDTATCFLSIRSSWTTFHFHHIFLEFH